MSVSYAAYPYFLDNMCSYRSTFVNGQFEGDDNSSQNICVICVRRTSTFVKRYRTFLLDPGTLLTFASSVLLITVVILVPEGLFSYGSSADANA